MQTSVMRRLALVATIDWTRPAAMGQQQPLSSLAAEQLVPAVSGHSGTSSNGTKGACPQASTSNFSIVDVSFPTTALSTVA